MTTQVAFLFFGHKLFPRFEQQIQDARRDLAGRADVHVIAYFETDSDIPEPFRTDPSFHAYGPERIAAFDYLNKGASPFSLMPGNCDLLLLAFSQDYPNYDKIWQFEYDVVFTGRLNEIVDAFENSPSHLLCTNVGRLSKYWRWHCMTRVPNGWPALPADVIRGFLPVFRVSRRLLEELDRFYGDGGAGHHEVTWPYVAMACSLSIEDIGGSGAFVKPGNRNRFYTSSVRALALYPGTFRYRPSMMRPGWRRSTLWHPVKEDRVPLREYLYERIRYLARWRWILTDSDKV